MSLLRDLYDVAWLATWGNNMAAVEWAVIVGLSTMLMRHKIGRYLAAFWAKHYGAHAIEHHLEALRRHEEEKGKGDSQ